ncbi:MAG: methyltransferase domain-containing protein [Ectothiorhodospiraceae bacterium]|nr:methyltransferase domain-containing protein [Ectothiorhodospiraceae bacterium]
MTAVKDRPFIENFQWNAVDYAANSSAQFEWGRELIESLDLASHESVLDVGCGDGKLTALIAQQVDSGSVTGVDSSPEMVALAQRTWGREKNMAFACMDAQNLAFAGNSSNFDVVFSNAVLHWVPDHRAVLAGIRRALKPNGRLLLQMPATGNCARFIEAVDRVREMPRWRRLFHDFTFPWCFSAMDDYTHWLSDAGFETQRIATINKDMCHEGPEPLAGWMRTTWLPYLQRLPNAERDPFVNAVVENYLCDVPLDAQGRTMWRWCAWKWPP